jgi:PadR family transcriptional regulator, regulatory protein PadR
MATAILRSLSLGFVKVHILYHAGREPVHGLWLIEELARHGYRFSPGTLYPILHGLEAAGLLAGERQVVHGKVRRCYRLTRAGKRALRLARAKAIELVKEIREGSVGE